MRNKICLSKQTVEGHFCMQTRVFRWRGDFARPRFVLGSSIRNL